MQDSSKFCLFDLIPYVPVNNHSVMLGRVFLGWSSTKRGLMCLAHNAVMPVRLEHAALQSRVKLSNTEPLRSLDSSKGSCKIAWADAEPHMLMWLNQYLMNWLIYFSIFTFLKQAILIFVTVHSKWMRQKFDWQLQARLGVLFCLIWFFTSHQQSFSYKGTGLPGLNQY